MSFYCLVVLYVFGTIVALIGTGFLIGVRLETISYHRCD